MFYLRPTQKNLPLQIFLTDPHLLQAGKTTSCGMTIYVLDHNDNPPVLKMKTYSGYVMESTAEGSLVMSDDGYLRILADDMDSGLAGVMKFQVEGGTGKEFIKVDPITGPKTQILVINS